MIYNGLLIKASAPEWHYYEVNEDGTIGQWLDSGGQGGADYEFDIYTVDEDGDEDESIDGGYESLEKAKAAIDEYIKNQTTFQSEAGN